MSKPNPFTWFKTGPEIIRLADKLHVRFPLAHRNAEGLLRERSNDIGHETVRFRWRRFGPMFVAEIRKRRIQEMKSSRWRRRLDEVFVKINGEMHRLWRAVDRAGEVLESFVTNTRDKNATLKFLRTVMRAYGRADVVVADKLRSHGAAPKEIGAGSLQETGHWADNQAENSPLPFRRRERAMLRFRRTRSPRKFAAVHASASNQFNQGRILSPRNQLMANRATALAERRGLLVA